MDEIQTRFPQVLTDCLYKTIPLYFTIYFPISAVKAKIISLRLQMEMTVGTHNILQSQGDHVTIPAGITTVTGHL